MSIYFIRNFSENHGLIAQIDITAWWTRTISD